jgi:hypothetical protein
MDQRRGRWTLIAGMLLLPALYLAFAGVHTGTKLRLPARQEATVHAQVVARHTEVPGVSSPLHQVTLRITGMS